MHGLNRNGVVGRCLGLVAALFLFGACTQVPVTEFGEYQTAFSEVVTVSGDVLSDFERTQRQVEQRARAGEDTSGRLSFAKSLDDFQGNDEAQQTTDVRRRAIAAVYAFNQVLSELAEGKRAEAVGVAAGGAIRTLGQFAAIAASTTVPWVGPVAGGIQRIITELQAAKDRKQFIAAVRAGAPTISELLDNLIADADDHFKLRATLNEEEAARISRRLNEQIETMRALLAARNAPAARVATYQAQVNAALADAPGAITESPVTFTSGGAGTPALSGDDGVKLETTVTAVEDLAERHPALVDEVNKTGTALVRYRDLLRTTKTAMQQLVASLDEPTDISALVVRMLELTFGLKQDLEDLRTALNEAPQTR